MLKTILNLTALAGLLTLSACQTGHHAKQVIKVTKDDAAKSVMAKFPQGTIQTGELEQWHGKMYWSFDLAMPNTKNITEVAVDPETGKVVWSGVETPEMIQAEKAGKKD